jgi:hypothetical protein
MSNNIWGAERRGFCTFKTDSTSGLLKSWISGSNGSRRGLLIEQTNAPPGILMKHDKQITSKLTPSEMPVQTQTKNGNERLTQENARTCPRDPRKDNGQWVHGG